MHVFSRGVGQWKRVVVRCPVLRRILLLGGVVILVSSGLCTVRAIALRKARVRRSFISIYCSLGRGGVEKYNKSKAGPECWVFGVCAGL